MALSMSGVSCLSREFSFNNTVNVTFNYNGDITFLEHVVVTATLNLTGAENMTRMVLEMEREMIEAGSLHVLGNYSLPRRGYIQIELLSPSGTKSILLPYRDNDLTPYGSLQTVLSILRLPGELSDGYIEWPFMSVHFWGEDPRGEWTLTFRYRGKNYAATFEGLSINLYGTLEMPEAVVNYSDCNSTCVGSRCARGGSSEYCHSCTNLRHADTLECIDVCPSGFQEVNGYCYDPNLPVPECNKIVEGMC